MTEDARNANALADLLDRVRIGEENTAELAVKLLDGRPSLDITLTRRRVEPEPPAPPVRAESPRRQHVFHDAVGLAAYLDRYKTENTVCWADVPDSTIYAVIDERAETGFEVLCCKPQTHPLIAPWADLIDGMEDEEIEPMPIVDFATFLLLNRRTIVHPDAKELVMLFSQVRSATRITANRGRGSKAVNGVMVETEIQGEAHNEPVELPDEITVVAPIYVGCESQTLHVDLLVTAPSPERIVVRVSSADLTVARVQAFDAMLAGLAEVLGDNVTIGRGRPVHGPWQYLAPRQLNG